MSQHFAPYPGPSFACGADATGQRNSRLDQDHHATTCMRCLASDAWVAAADAAGTGVTFAVYGENTLTGNRWECVTGLATMAEAVETRNGWTRLESDYKIAYYAEPEK